MYHRCKMKVKKDQNTRYQLLYIDWIIKYAFILENKKKKILQTEILFYIIKTMFIGDLKISNSKYMMHIYVQRIDR